MFYIGVRLRLIEAIVVILPAHAVIFVCFVTFCVLYISPRDTIIIKFTY